jgi:hypothetical protein
MLVPIHFASTKKHLKFGVLKKMNLKIVTIVFSLIAISCNKSIRDQDNSISMVEDYAYCELIFNDALNSVERVLLSENGFYKLNNNPEIPACASLTADTSVSPKKLTINYGTTDCADANGYIKKGKISCLQYGKFQQSGSQLVVKFENYYFNGSLFNGDLILKNNGKNTKGYYVHYVSFTNGSIKKENKTIYFSVSKTYTYTKGDTTKTFSDDEWSVIGKVNGTGFNGAPFNVSIDSVLIQNPTCNYPLSGKATLDAGGNLTDRLIDFGSGNCDKTLTVTVNGKANEVSLK